MYARLTALTLSLSLSSIDVRADMQQNHNNFAGFNFGGQFGIGLGNTRVYRQFKVDPAASDSTDMALSGVLGGVNIGYGWIMPQQYYLGIHGQYDYADISGRMENNYEIVNNSSSNQLQSKLQYTYSGFVRLGKIVNNVLPYLQAGVTYGYWKSNVTAAFQNSNGNNISENSKTLMGWTVGVGSDFLVTKNLSLGADYSYTRFNDFDFQYPGIIDYKVKPKLHTIMLNVRWYL